MMIFYARSAFRKSSLSILGTCVMSKSTILFSHSPHRVTCSSWWNIWTVAILCFTFKKMENSMRIVPDSTVPKSFVDCSSYTRTTSFTGKSIFYIALYSTWLFCDVLSLSVINLWLILFFVLYKYILQWTWCLTHRNV